MESLYFVAADAVLHEIAALLRFLAVQKDLAAVSILDGRVLPALESEDRTVKRFLALEISEFLLQTALDALVETVLALEEGVEGLWSGGVGHAEFHLVGQNAGLVLDELHLFPSAPLAELPHLLGQLLVLDDLGQFVCTLGYRPEH